MKVFSWDGEIDTIMKPIDSIRYYKHFLRSSLMSIEPISGHVKAWVGGYNYKHFQYDQVKQGRRQIGSTFKPFLYATAIDQLKLSPCDSLPDALYCIETNTPAYSGSYGEQPTRWVQYFFIIKNALAKKQNMIQEKMQREAKR